MLDSHVFKGRLEYLVHWEGYGPQENSWENSLELAESAAEAIADFCAAHPDAVSGVDQRPSWLCQRQL